MKYNTANLKTGFDFIENSKHEFYLTGSRYFGHFRYNSDFDFAVQYSEDVCYDLENYGFFNINKLEKKYKDSNLLHVYQFGNVQIQVRKDIQHFLRAQDLAAKLPYQNLQHITDTDWNLLFALTI